MDLFIRLRVREDGSSVIVGRPCPRLPSASWQPDGFYLIAVRRFATDCRFVPAYLCISGVDRNGREIEGPFLGPTERDGVTKGPLQSPMITGA